MPGGTALVVNKGLWKIRMSFRCIQNSMPTMLVILSITVIKYLRKQLKEERIYFAS
jgi:hypothetical protein